ncbi:cytochrome c oxidase subunit 3 [Novosphingobium sp. M1R2S20]|uniref:Cytochrome c oxidase subunit 3 n=1 Tax=Novosphingobium rhizovicinum TaxID=3228928 RepID=A0ABV3RHU6_9SPHN
MPEQSRAEIQFHHIGRQREAERLGMLVFLASEIMLFGGVFLAALALRMLHPQEYVAAASHMKLWHGTANTAILLTSSLLVALAVEWTRGGRPKWAARCLWAAVALGLTFLGVKAHEYYLDYREGKLPGAANANFSTPFEQLFSNFYFSVTGLHALHVTAGIILLALAALRGEARHDRHAVFIGNVALYWHLVDVFWIFLYPTIYLAGAGE